MHPKRQFARANFVLLDGIFTYEVLPHFVIKEQLMNEINTPSSIGSAYGTKDVLPNKYLHMKRSFYIDEAFLLNDLIELYKNETDENAKNLESIKSERDKLTKMLITNGKTEDSSDYEEDFE